MEIVETERIVRNEIEAKPQKDIPSMYEKSSSLNGQLLA
jgi:hypothetical protein